MILNPFPMRKRTPPPANTGKLIKLLITFFRDFFNANTNREFRRLKDFISS